MNGSTKRLWPGIIIPSQILLIFGFVLALVSSIVWYGSRQSVADDVTMPLVVSFPTRAGERSETKFQIRSLSDYVLRLQFKPANLLEFKAQHQQIVCDIDLRLKKDDNLVLQEKVDKLALATERGERLGYDIAWTKPLTPGQYSLYVDNHQDILSQGTESPDLVAFINPANLETRVVIHDILTYLSPALVLIGIIAIVKGLSKRSSNMSK